ncbi:DUF1127 domain-containing protein [Granulosicoccaceae sp. 1_MG-2023]|nr:DUF1127 domain-containing protein [Granulosicoccaceae sp. 1_MG-2023]
MATASEFFTRLTAVFETVGRERARRELLNLSDRYLEDLGFSRALLQEGAEAWPWRTEEDRPAYLTPAQPVHTAQEQTPTLARVA